MSHNVSKSSPHGFCDAIFSMSPIKFDKENKSPRKDVSRELHRDLFTESHVVKNQNKKIQSLHKKQKLYTKNEISQFLDPSKSFSNVDDIHSKSTTALLNHDSFICGNVAKTSVKTESTSRISGNKAASGHLHTPKQHKTCLTPRNIKMNVLSTTKTPTKKYLSDHNLSQATPDCFSRVQLETPSIKSNDVNIDEGIEGENSNLTVGIRVRPLNLKELSEVKIASVINIDGQSIIVDCETSLHKFTYDHCFASYSDSSMPRHASQEVIFNTMALPLIQNAFEGYNVCLFAYGQTGSGKSYSMMGIESFQENSIDLDKEAGIIPRFCQEIFTQIPDNKSYKTTVEISYFEIYNEKIHDLLASTTNGDKRTALKVREHPVFGPYIVDLSQHCIKNYKDLQIWLKVGNSQRATAATGMNEKSSRSHSIFSIILTQTQLNDLKCSSSDASRRSKINLVDLAGSERLSQTCASGNRLREGVSINKSLLTLGKVIASLAESTSNRKRGFVPYRESVLTWLLKESLGGNSRTAMLGTVSPANIHLEETLATLRYASQARAIVNRIRINEDPHDRLIRELKAEVLRLRAVREGYEKQLRISPRNRMDHSTGIEPNVKDRQEIVRKQEEINRLKEQLKKTEEQLVATQKSNLKKLQETEERKNSELKYLRRCGIAVEIDLRERDKQPYLINLAADPMLSGTLLYLIPPGLVRIGKRSENSDKFQLLPQLDIVLDGPLVRKLHCTIENKNGKLMLVPEMNGDTYVNGQVISGKIHLRHGDRLVIGGNHYFKVCNPHDEIGNIQISSQAIDFDFAHQEILKIQEEKLRAELEESKQKAIKELENAKREVELQLGSQKFTYEHKIEVLGSTLEEQKLALEEINRRKQELELEKEMLANEIKINNRIKEIQQVESKSNVSPYKSNFLQDLECILNETTADFESALKIKCSAETIKAGGISLHEMQIFVREATERCREVGINYEFNQQQTLIDKNLRPVIRVRDKDRKKETLWEPMRFLDWVHQLRDYDIENSLKELKNSENDWVSYDDTETFEDSLNSSRISINLTPVKKHLNESFQQLSMDTSIHDSTTQEEASESQQRKNVSTYLLQIERATQALSILCQRCESPEINNTISESLDRVQNIIVDIRSMLLVKNLKDNKNESENSNGSVNNNTTVIEKIDCKNSVLLENIDHSKEDVKSNTTSPIKSNLRNNTTAHVKNGNILKSVRFTDKIQHHLT
ncbi:PREDICTED: kinesin-like protein KIF14 [Polistes canadensis]|uniref:kinesin-like protein KIF14 n=1 Tax=Polistes canadensis TaxID=91411 RepID=UPI000718B61E|nr:PREDICTED: kinesin-like protein KIF14 [Polistes canadensis]